MFRNEKGIFDPFGAFVITIMMLMGVMAYQEEAERKQPQETEMVQVIK